MISGTPGIQGVNNRAFAKTVLPNEVFFFSLCAQIFADMKKGIHPENYRFVVFKDMSNGQTFLSRSAAATKDNITWDDGKEYPLIKLEISNTSHPFYTGKMQFVDTAGRIDKFKKKYARKGAEK
jgi:large subunit ribosomal protein L31